MWVGGGMGVGMNVYGFPHISLPLYTHTSMHTHPDTSMYTHTLPCKHTHTQKPPERGQWYVPDLYSTCVPVWGQSTAQPHSLGHVHLRAIPTVCVCVCGV